MVEVGDAVPAIISFIDNATKRSRLYIQIICHALRHKIAGHVNVYLNIIKAVFWALFRKRCSFTYSESIFIARELGKHTD